MGTSKRERQKAGHRARLSAERAAQARYERRRRLIFLGALSVLVIGAAGLLTYLGKNSSSTATSTATTLAPSSSTTTAAPLPSAAGKPCVAFSDTLPKGAPEVPVPVGPPPTTLVTKDLKAGTGDPVPAGATVTVNYIGVSCSTGKIFDSSWAHGQAVTFPLDNVIKGWSEGLVGMKDGGERLLVIPPDLAYGSQGQGPIAPDETLVFVVDLQSWTPPTAATTAAGG